MRNKFIVAACVVQYSFAAALHAQCQAARIQELTGPTEWWCFGRDTAYSVVAGGSGPFTYQWRVRGTDLVDGVQTYGAIVSGSRSDRLTIIGTTQFEIGGVEVVLSNACGSVTSEPVYVGACISDLDDGSGTGTCDGGATIDDLLYYFQIFAQGLIRADFDDGSFTGTPDGGVNVDDLLYHLLRAESDC